MLEISEETLFFEICFNLFDLRFWSASKIKIINCFLINWEISLNIEIIHTIVAPYSGAMLAMVALSARESDSTPGPKNSTNFPTTPFLRNI